MSARRRGSLRRRRASRASRTTASSPAAAATSTTSRCRGCCTRAFVRSPASRTAAITGIDTAAARALPGVVAVLTAERPRASPIRSEQLGGRTGYLRPVFTALASDRVRHVGDPVAIVVAETRARGRGRAATRSRSTTSRSTAVATIEQALGPGTVAPIFDDIAVERLLHGGARLRRPGRRVRGRPRGVAMTLRAAARGARCRWRAAAASPTTTRAPASSIYYVDHAGAARPPLRPRGVLGQPLDRLRVISPDVGGVFGQKTAMLAARTSCVCAASKRLGRPVKWVEDRIENMTAATHAREERIDVDAAVDGRRHDPRARREDDARPGRLPGAATFSPLFGSVVRHMMSGRLPARRACAGPHRRGDQQGLLRRLPRPVGDRDAHPRAARRPDRARARPRSRSTSAAAT